MAIDKKNDYDYEDDDEDDQSRLWAHWNFSGSRQAGLHLLKVIVRVGL